MCSGQCVDTQTDNNNCGGCGLACSVPCSAGGCLVALASGQVWPDALATDDTSVYWVDNDDVGGGVAMKVPVGGGTPITLAANVANPGVIVVDAVSAYWTGGGWFATDPDTVVKVPLGGGALTTLVSVPSGVNGPRVIAVDPTSLYWSSGWTGGAAMTKTPLDGGTPTRLASGQNGVGSIAVDTASVYWTTSTAIMKVPVGGGSLVTLVSGENGPGSIAVDATSVYWTNGDGSVMKAPLGGGTLVTLASGQNGPGSIVVDAANVYWANMSDVSLGEDGGVGVDTVVKVPLDGGTPTTLASGLALVGYGAGAIAVGATSVYWAVYAAACPADGGSGVCEGTVMKLTPK